MYDLWLLSLLYRICKAIFTFISRNWVLIIFAILIAAICGIAVGGFFISLHAFLNVRNTPNKFEWSIALSMALQMLGFYFITTDFYKEFPFLYKATAVGNTAGLFMTLLYFVRCILYQSIHSKCEQWFYSIGLVFTSFFILFLFNYSTHFINYTASDGKDFPFLLRKQKQIQYAAAFEEMQASHLKFSKNDYYHYNRLKGQRLKQDIKNQTVGEDTLLILSFSHQFDLIYYTFEDNGTYEELVQKPLLEGMDARFRNGILSYAKDSLFTNMDSFYFEQARFSQHPIYEETTIKLEVLPQTLDDFVAYKEGGGNQLYPDLGTIEMYVSLEYLKSKGIPINILPYPDEK